MHDEIPEGARLASRVIMIDRDRRVLYLQAQESRTGRVFWVMPGGGLKPGESFEDAAKREGFEESGCHFVLGPQVWFRHHRYVWEGRDFDQYERFFVATASDPSYKPLKQDGYIRTHKWWTLEELLASKEIFAPRRVRDIIVPVLNGEYPEVPFDCGV